MNTQEKAYSSAVNSCRNILYMNGIQNQSKMMRTASNIFSKYRMEGKNTNTKNADNTDTSNRRTDANSYNAGSKGMDTTTIGLQLKEAVDSIFDPTTGMTEKEKDNFVKKLYRKLESGKKLTQDEMQYLRMNDPVTYAKAARVQVMREAFKKQLENAKSKEEASDMYLTNMSRVGDDDPAKKELEAAYEDVYSQFKKTDVYKKLPDTRKEAREQNDSHKKHDRGNVNWKEDNADDQ